jgi:AcrR family transcriptional regulator
MASDLRYGRAEIAVAKSISAPSNNQRLLAYTIGDCRLSTMVDKMPHMSDRRHNTRKSDRTRAAILDAARRLFAEHGHDGTTVRDIAAAASIDPAMVIRYFGSKDELFVRASAFDLRLPDLSKVKRAQVGETLIRHFLELGDGSGGMTVLLRSAASNEYAAARVLELFATQVVPAFGRFGSRATASKHAGLVASQLLGVALCRYILKVPPVAQMTREEIVKKVGPTLQQHATGAASIAPNRARWRAISKRPIKP